LAAATAAARSSAVEEDSGLGGEGLLEVGGMDVHAGGGDDEVAFAADEAEFAIGAALGEIAGGEPLVLTLLHGAVLPGCAGDDLSADQDFAVVGDADLAAREGFADGAGLDVKGVIERDQRAGFGHAVALDEGEAEAVIEGFKVGGEGGAAGDDGPEPPT